MKGNLNKNGNACMTAILVNAKKFLINQLSLTSFCWLCFESFVRLLEYAEEELKCSHLIVCFKKDRPDRGDYSTSSFILHNVLIHLWCWTPSPIISSHWLQSGTLISIFSSRSFTSAGIDVFKTLKNKKLALRILFGKSGNLNCVEMSWQGQDNINQTFNWS